LECFFVYINIKTKDHEKAILILLSMGLIYGASAQRFRRRNYYARPRVSVSVGICSLLPLLWLQMFSFYLRIWFGSGYPYYGYHQPYRPSKLDLKVEDIKKDYQDKIWSVNDKNLSGKEKKRSVQPETGT
jgi:hypothetical protein